MREVRVTLVQVAQRAGVSKTTAGYVLSGQDRGMRIAEETRHRVLRAAVEMNYRPSLLARHSRRTSTPPIAIISDTLVTEPYGGELILGCLAAAAHHGHLALVGETRRDTHLEQALVDEFIAQHIEHFIFVTVYPREIDIPKQLDQLRVVTLNCAASEKTRAAVLPDEKAAGRLAGRLLIDAGITEAIHLVGDRPLLPYGPGREREAGMRQSLDAAGLTLAGTHDCAWEPEAAYDTVRAALRSGIRPASLVCMNDRIAFGTYQALTEAGQRIPHDVSVLAFEGSQLATWLKPALTTIDRDMHAMGWRAVELLVQPDPPQSREHLPGILRMRDSMTKTKASAAP